MSRRKCKDCTQIFANIATVIIAIAAIASPWFIYRQGSRQFKETIDHGDEQFELVNRPFIELISPQISVIGKNLDRGDLPEIKFVVGLKFINHGKLPAYIKTVECVIENLEEHNEHCLAMPHLEDKTWGNFDVFPFIGAPFNYTIWPSLNVGDLYRTMRLEDSFKKEIINKDSEFWQKEDDEIKRKFTARMKPFFLAFQIEYYKMGDDYNKAKAYFYSVKFKIYNNLSDRSFIESIAGNTEKEGKWFKIGAGGSITRIKNQTGIK